MEAINRENDTLSAIAGALGMQYWLLTPDGEQGYTPFQGFGLNIANPEFIQLVELLAVLPASPFEIFLPPESLPVFRRPLPRKQAAIIGLPSFRAAWADITHPGTIQVVIGMPGEVEAARGFFHYPHPLFVTVPPVAGVVSLAEYVGHPAQFLDKTIRDRLALLLPRKLWAKFVSLPLRAPFDEGTVPSRGAGVTAPNERLSISLGYDYSGTDPVISHDRQAYVDAILASVSQARSMICESSTDIVLYAPAILRHLHAFGSDFWNKLFRKIDSRQLREIIRDGVFRNPHYSGFGLPLKNVEDLPNPYEHPIAGQILQIRQIELQLTAAGIGALATSSMQPALRLPNAINFHAASLREIERHSHRDSERGRKLLQKTYKTMVNAIERQISPEIIEDMRSRTESITLVTDAPIEWLRVEGLPLMIRHDVSRIGMTPGNLMLHQCVLSRMLILDAAALDDILVVRAFAEDDHIRGHLEHALGAYGIDRLRIRFVDVDDRAGLVACLNAFAGMLVIFDCHGGHGGDDSHGWLKIGRDKVDPWQLGGEARVPPIVILSACSTFALAGSHASVANGLIRSGAVSVIGTFLPVQSAQSAIFVARLLYRIDAFLPALKALDRNFVTWRTLVSTFLRMSFATDLLNFFIRDKAWLSGEMFTRIGRQANFDINTLRSDWYRRFVRRIAWVARRPIFQIQLAIDTESPLVESMLYCQIGRPELIGIHLGDSAYSQ